MHTLVLFDIDGTLLWGGRAARASFHDALIEVWGTTGPVEDHEFSGKTDPQIVRELLTLEGFDRETIEEGLERFWQLYLEGLRDRIVDHPPYALPGAADVVAALQREGGVALGLVTGNIAPAAEIKLAAVGLDGSFAVGGYGSDHEVRNQLPGIAIERATGNWGVEFGAEAVWVIGDTPRDVECGKHHGTRTLAVATGHFDTEALRKTEADVVVDDFSEHDAVVEVLLTS